MESLLKDQAVGFDESSCISTIDVCSSSPHFKNNQYSAKILFVPLRYFPLAAVCIIPIPTRKFNEQFFGQRTSYLSTFDVGNISDFISSLDSPYLITRELCDRHELAKTFETPLKAAAQNSKECMSSLLEII